MSRKMYSGSDMHRAAAEARLKQIGRSAEIMQALKNQINELEKKNTSAEEGFAVVSTSMAEQIRELEAENARLKGDGNTLLVDASAVLNNVSPLLDEARETLERSHARCLELEAENAGLREKVAAAERGLPVFRNQPDMVDVMTFDGYHARVKIENPSNGVYEKYWHSSDSSDMWRIEWCPRCYYTISIDVDDMPKRELDWNILLTEAMFHICVKDDAQTTITMSDGVAVLSCACGYTVTYDDDAEASYGDDWVQTLTWAFKHTH